jgi:hypothetical protein
MKLIPVGEAIAMDSSNWVIFSKAIIILATPLQSVIFQHIVVSQIVFCRNSIYLHKYIWTHILKQEQKHKNNCLDNDACVQVRGPNNFSGFPWQGTGGELILVVFQTENDVQNYH